MKVLPSQAWWAVGLAALVGGVAGSFVAAWMDSLGVSTEGSHPVLGGAAALYAAFPSGAVLGMSCAAVVAFIVGRRGLPSLAAVLGSVTGIGAGAVAGYFSENLTEAWINWFGGNPFEGGLAGGIIAGALAGVATASIIRTLRPPTPPGTVSGGSWPWWVVSPASSRGLGEEPSVSAWPRPERAVTNWLATHLEPPQRARSSRQDRSWAPGRAPSPGCWERLLQPPCWPGWRTPPRLVRLASRRRTLPIVAGHEGCGRLPVGAGASFSV